MNANYDSVYDQLLRGDWREMKGTDFENFLGRVFDALGYAVEVKAGPGDDGVDLIVTGQSKRIAVQAKGYKGSVGKEAVQEVHTGMVSYKCDECMVITNSLFTPQARQLAFRVHCRLVEGDKIPYLVRGEVLPFYPSDFTLPCPQCRGKIIIQAKNSGTRVQCVFCKKVFLAPRITFSPEDLFRRGKKLVQEGDLGEGYAILQSLLRTHPRFQSVYLFYAESYLERQNHKKAFDFYEKALDLGKLQLVFYFHASLSAYELKEYAQAYSILKEAEEEFPKAQITGYMWYKMGCFASLSGRSEESMRFLRRAVNACFIDLEKYKNNPDLNSVRSRPDFKRLLARMNRLQQSCPHCQKILIVKKKYAGQSMKCPNCSGVFISVRK